MSFDPSDIPVDQMRYKCLLRAWGNVWSHPNPDVNDLYRADLFFTPEFYIHDYMNLKLDMRRNMLIVSHFKHVGLVDFRPNAVQ